MCVCVRLTSLFNYKLALVLCVFMRLYMSLTSLFGVAHLWGGAAVANAVLEDGLLQLPHLLLLALALLLAALPHRLAQVLLQRETPRRLTDLPLKRQLSLQRTKHRLLQHNTPNRLI